MMSNRRRNDLGPAAHRLCPRRGATLLLVLVAHWLGWILFPAFAPPIDDDKRSGALPIAVSLASGQVSSPGPAPVAVAPTPPVPTRPIPAPPSPSSRSKPMPARPAEAPVRQAEGLPPLPAAAASAPLEVAMSSSSRPEARDDAAASPPPAAPAAEPTPPSASADYLSNPAPPYPPLSRQLRDQGVVLLRVRVSANGRPEAVLLQQTSGHPRLDQAAIDAVERWRFVPAHLGDDAVAGWVLVPIRFALRD